MLFILLYDRRIVICYFSYNHRIIVIIQNLFYSFVGEFIFFDPSQLHRCMEQHCDDKRLGEIEECTSSKQEKCNILRLMGMNENIELFW